MVHKVPLPPRRGAAQPANPNGGPETNQSPAQLPKGHPHVPPHLAAMTKHDARLVNLDTGTHVDSRGVEHKTHPGNPARVGPLTVVFAHAMGHPPMRFGDHVKQKTNVAKHMRGKAQPHPNALAIKIAGQMKLPRAPKKAAPPAPPQAAGAPAPLPPPPAAAAPGAPLPPPAGAPPMRVPLPPRRTA